MKRVPETFELDEDDIREAIAYWLNREVIESEYEEGFEIEFSTQRVACTPPPGAPVGGQSDWTKIAVSAIAIKE